ncbi:zinc finger protein 280A-like [Limulus polyphemus]|uniref:Zinc finger protein 280A-like n=1 Tax=Limulus polyphemus TaxID=6850 RepID=A0ABM1TJ44_LIMPO|nr:zinc finger protein 280A-like [Limulus polyphemus]
MKHINCHIENTRQKNPDLSDLTQCKYCFRDFETPFSMQCHIETVHMKMDASTCHICNQAFSSRFTLCAHMKSVHVECEMPYVCKVHNGSDKFQCHYCLEVFTARISPVQKIGMTQNFFLHLQKHQLKSQSRKCPACCLVFTNSNSVKTHRTTDHISMAEAEGVIRMKAQRNEKDVVIRDPHIKPVKMAKGRISPVRKELGSISQPPVIFKASEEKRLDLNITADTSHLRCIECKNNIDYEHFRQFLY